MLTRPGRWKLDCKATRTRCVDEAVQQFGDQKCVCLFMNEEDCWGERSSLNIRCDCDLDGPELGVWVRPGTMGFLGGHNSKADDAEAQQNALN